MEEKKCPKCLNVKKLSEFNKDKREKRGVRSRCRECTKEEQRLSKTPSKSKEKQRAYFLKKKYGLSPEEFDLQMSIQKKSCAVCGLNFKRDTDARIDHCHNSGRVRGILCNNCNIAIGHFKDCPDRLKSAIVYLEK